MRWGILATGMIARKFADTVNRMAGEGEKLIAAGSRSAEKAKAFAEEFGIPKYYGSYEELAADPDIDTVYIASPNNLHKEHTLLCLNAGKHVLCEKPFTTNARDAEELYELGREKGLFVMEAFWIRFLPLYDLLLNKIRENEFGALKYARCDYGFIARGARRERKLLSELGGGALLDIGIYNLGFLHMVMGESPDSFSSEVHINEYGTDDFSAVLLKYPGGGTACAAQSIGTLMERRAALYFENATIYLPDFQGAFEMTVCPTEGEPTTVKCPADINGYEYEIREVTEKTSGGHCHSAVHTPEDSVAVLQLMDDIRASWNMKFSFEGE